MNQAPHTLRYATNGYERQLTSARRIARINRSMRPALDPEEEKAYNAAKRMELVEKISREILENLLVSGSESQIVQDVKRRLELEFNQVYEFTYPFDGGEVRIFAMGEKEPEEVHPPEKYALMQKLWEITQARVNATMI